MAYTDGQFTGIVNTELTKSSEKMTTSQLQTMVQDAITNERSVSLKYLIENLI